MKILNLYAGIGGNRRLWGDEHEITAVEYRPDIAAIYHDFFPNDKIVVADAHQYLLEHFEEFDFIWSSPPCPSHSQARKIMRVKRDGVTVPQNKPIYPDMKLYEEILLLRGYFEGKWCVENVVPWYEPLIPAVKFAGHLFWTNFGLPDFAGTKRGIKWDESLAGLQAKSGFDLSRYKGADKRLLLRNCVEPELGKHILDWSQTEWHHTKSLL